MFTKHLGRVENHRTFEKTSVHIRLFLELMTNIRATENRAGVPATSTQQGTLSTALSPQHVALYIVLAKVRLCHRYFFFILLHMPWALPPKNYNLTFSSFLSHFTSMHLMPISLMPLFVFKKTIAPY